MPSTEHGPAIESQKVQVESSALSSPFAVQVQNVTVSFRSYKERPTSFKESVLRFMRSGRLKYYSTFDALSDVSLDIPRGQVFGVIGSNGAGKSTLLRTISGVLKPARGRVTVNGRLDSLISLGAGFDSELDAVENIFLNGSLYRRSREEMRGRVAGILAFAELEDFAGTPIKYYSSGMHARLGFSVAIDRDPEILLVDEILAVGDERFQAKCRQVFERYIKEGKTIVLVTHDMSVIKSMAHQVVLLAKGRVVFVGEPKKAVELYQDKSYQTALGPSGK